MTSAATLTMAPASRDDVQLNSVLAATDFSATSEKSLRHALAIARYYGAKPYALHVTPSYGDVSAAALLHARQLERELCANGGQFVVREGDVWAELQEFIRQRHVDLVVVGTHGRKGLKKVVLGSVAEQVFRNVSCPVLTVGPYSPHGFEIDPRGTARPVLLATDFCESCANALNYAISFANRRGTRLALLHVLSPAPAVKSKRWYTAEDVAREQNATRAAAFQRLDGLVSRRPLALNAVCMAEFGDAADTILWAAEKLQAEVIIMGLQRRAFNEPHLSWSTAYQVVCTARSPVLTIRSV